MNTYRVSYQNYTDKVIRNKHKRIKAISSDNAKDLVQSLLGNNIAIYKVELI